MFPFFFIGNPNNKYCQKKWVNNAYKQWKNEEGWLIAIVETLAITKKRIKDLNFKLTEVDRDKKSAEATVVGAERQAEDQCQ